MQIIKTFEQNFQNSKKASKIINKLNKIILENNNLNSEKFYKLLINKE